jgi:hypothetical protein
VPWKLLVTYFVVRSVDWVRLHHINDFKHEYSASFGIDPLAPDLVPLIVTQKLLFSLQLLPHMVQGIVRHK